MSITDNADDTFDALFRQYEQPICSYLARLTGNTARAQELAQETFIRAYRALIRGERWENPRAWLYRVASRLATDDYRRRKLVEWLPLSAVTHRGTPGIEAATIERISIQSALDALPPKYRVPLVLYDYVGYSIAEIGQMLGLTASGVKTRLSRARKKFRQIYESEAG
ncbi:MAG: RNA polymerase sigma factor [Chloroflexi bacterium]|nr:RNA polymerase sigma factor [Chloroflexota bacterium]